ncbi:MAG TPA: hypothetical protein VHK01_07185 [Lacipirellulaceae bacterium]|nr:hypothetical protein [Lacipirellulaceae bacterium]
MRLQSGIKRMAASTILAAVLIVAVRADFRSLHLGYVVPQDRTAQSNAAENIAAMMRVTQAWYEEQMDRWGFGPKTFRFEGGAGPIVHTVSTPITAAQIRSDIWAQTISAAQGAGLPVWSSGQVWFLISEAHQQQADGDIIGGTALGAGFGSGNDAGTAMLGGDTIFRLNPTMLRNTRPYHGQVVSAIGPYPLVQGTSFPSFEQSTFSSIGSSVQGAAIHELGHAFGLPHNMLNDANFNGNLMGNGLRGLRGVLEPQLFPQDDTRLSYASALMLSTNRYFDYDNVFTDNIRPTLSISTSGSVSPIDGLLEIGFSGSDSGGLSAAILLRDGDVVGQMRLSGNTVNEVFKTPYYSPGQADEFEVRLYDRQGNRQTREVTLTPLAAGNRAPRPSISIDHSIVRIGQSVVLEAAASSDPDNSGGLQVEWDIDGDGVFDTTPSSTLNRLTSFSAPGTRQVSARLTDALGASAISAPIGLRVLGPSGDANLDNNVDMTDYDAWKTSFGRRIIPYYGPDFNGDGWVDAADYVVWRKMSEVPTPGLAVPEPRGGLCACFAAAAGLGLRRRLTWADAV